MDGILFIGSVIIVITVVIFITVYALKKYIVYITDKRIAEYQSSSILKHYNEIKLIYKKMSSWRHDYHNHLQVMKALLTLDSKEEHMEYLNTLNSDLVMVDTMVKTGSILADAILNSKISIAQAQDIHVNAKAKIPSTLILSETELCVIIGNLLDNAVEACVKIREKDKRFIRIYIGIYKKMLYISVSNSIKGKIIISKSGYKTTKNTCGHGLGINNIDRIISKYGGFINRQCEEGIFACELMLPNTGK